MNYNQSDVNDKMNPEMESSIWCQVKLNNKDTLLVGVCYRSPNSTELNNSKLVDQLKKIDNQRFSIAPTVSKRFNPGENFSGRCSRKTFFY